MVYEVVKIDTQDKTSIKALQSDGFFLVSIMVNLLYSTCRKRTHFRPIGKIRAYKKGDLESLRRIAMNSMHYDHFHSDPYFSKEISDSVYEALIENCCKGALADKVFVVEKNKKPVGYVACKIRDGLNKILPVRIGHIRHLAVSSSQGFGSGPGLQEAALDWFEDKVDIVESATTIQNLPILKIALKSGMDIACSFLRFSKRFKA